MSNKAACCCASSDEIVQIGIDGDTVGLAALNQIFEQLRILGRPADESVEDELLEMVAMRNYIPPAAEEQYRYALRREYGKYCARKTKPAR